jgi:hypothetical protein
MIRLGTALISREPPFHRCLVMAAVTSGGMPPAAKKLLAQI